VKTLLFFAALLSLAQVAACAPSAPPDASPETVTGVVLRVEGQGAADVTGFQLRTDDGQLLEFDVERLDLSGGGLPAPHLREHLRDGEPIAVDYVVEDGRNRALRYTDAP
jgi:hypothetical protein